VIAVGNGRIELREFHLAGEGTDLRVGGSVGLAPTGAVDVSVEGAADLRALSLVSTELRGHGAARLSVFLAGSREAPEVAGTLDLDGDGIRMRGFPHGIEDVKGRITFDAHRAQWTGVTGTVGGGAVELSGQAAHQDGRLTTFDVQGTGRNLSLRYPEGLKSTVDAELRLFGDEARQWLTGAIDVRQAVWTRRYDVASELLAIEQAPAPGDPRLSGGVRFDVKVRAPGTLRIDNNLATLQARADLALQGTYDAPALLGRAEIDRGRVYFQGNTYVIRRGSIDFSNPQKIDPLFDVEAEARVRSYNVVLKTQGTLDRVTPTLTSDPPLSTVGILSLLAGADESEVERTSQLRDRSELAATGAATLAAGRLSEQFGLERRASRLGLSRFSIDPTVGVRGEYRNSTVRLTAGKRLTPDLSVVYSQELRGSDEHLLSLEYSLSDKLSLLLTRAAPGGLGFDLRLRRTE
jgi:translocation and assembly module TamB